MGFSELLEMELTDPVQRQYASTIRASGEHLHTLVTDVLDLAKIEAGRMNLSPDCVDLPQMLNAVIDMQRASAQKKGLSIELMCDNIPAQVYADPGRLRQVLLNLTNNAIKFTDHGGVTVRAMQPDETRVRIEIQDTGIGITPGNESIIFEKFRQGEQFITRSHQGTGLGLTLAKELTEHMNGRIAVVSTPGVGATFSIELPAAPTTTDANDV
jgi:signal transduction histidine kinase